MARRATIWGVAAVVAVLALAAVLANQSDGARQRWPVFLSGSPARGEQLFEDKGCARCHAVNGVGARSAPDLGRQRSAQSSAQLVTAMWNHAPQMWTRMRDQGRGYPTLDYTDVAQLLAYLYMARFVDAAGDADHGRQLFHEKSCDRCHALGGGTRIGPDLGAPGQPLSAVAWTQALWNHAWTMQDRMATARVDWPQFADNELRDLLAYIRAQRGVAAMVEVETGDPEAGWRVFQAKACNACHSIRGEDGSVAPYLGPGGKLPQTFVQFGGAMLNHSPQMRRVMQQHGIPQPEFKGVEMADVAAFLYSLGYSDPAGSPHVGRSVFAWRGCNRCHGDDAEGGPAGPGLRGRSKGYTTVTLATSLWGHGERMLRQNQQLGLNWPTLLDSDVGDLLSFLNAPLEPSRARR